MDSQNEPHDSMENELRDTLNEQWPISNIRVECGVCGEFLYKADADSFTIATPSFVYHVVMAISRRHYRETEENHSDIDIDLVTMESIDEIDCTITTGSVE